MPENNNVELRSEEVQEVMNRVPPAILRIGITIMALIIAIFFSIAFFVEIPVAEDCTFTMDTDEAKNIIYLSQSSLKSVQSGDTTEVRLHSDMFPSEYSSGISTVITMNQISLDSTGNYVAVFRTPPEIEAYLSYRRFTIKGTATMIVTNTTLLDSFKFFGLKPDGE